MNRRTLLTISSVAACAALGGAAAWMVFSPKTNSEPIQVTTVGQGGQPTPKGQTPPPGPPGRGPRPGGPAAGAPARTGGQAPGAPGGQKGGIFGNAPSKGAPPAATPPKPTVKAVPNRKGWDPFFIRWTPPIPPPYVFAEVEPIRLAPEEVEPIKVKPYEVREEAVARVSGIMSGDGIYAILELPSGDPVIVKPGSSVDLPVANGQTKRTYRVVSIKGDTVVLRAKEGEATFTQEIPLSDVPLGGSGARPGGGPGFGGPGSGGFPGSSGGPGFPGRPGGGRPGVKGSGGPGGAGLQ